jgi:chromosomal replication initiator protein
MNKSLWYLCLKQLEKELPPQDLNTWIRPLQVHEELENVFLFAPNLFVLNWVKTNYLQRIIAILTIKNHGIAPKVTFQVGTRPEKNNPTKIILSSTEKKTVSKPIFNGNLFNKKYTFNNFIAGYSNQLAHAASMQVVESSEFNPLFIYGNVGIGKTHLMQAVGHTLRTQQPELKVIYLRSEQFINDMVKSFRTRNIDKFKRFYKSADVLLIDDVQFLAGKTKSQEEFFHIFNSLIDGQQRVILTSNNAPQRIDGLNEQLKSRLGHGLTVEIKQPELETRANILQSKALNSNIILPEDVTFYIAEHIDSNVRELEGALHRLVASAKFMREEINLDFSKDALKDLIIHKVKFINIGDIQSTVARYFKLSTAELISRSRKRYIVRPRQIAMSLCKDLTPHNLVQIGHNFAGRDRTTVIYSHKTITALRLKDMQLNRDYNCLLQILS